MLPAGELACSSLLFWSYKWPPSSNNIHRFVVSMIPFFVLVGERPLPAGEGNVVALILRLAVVRDATVWVVDDSASRSEALQAIEAILFAIAFGVDEIPWLQRSHTLVVVPLVVIESKK